MARSPKTRVVSVDGPPCPSCGQPTEVRDLLRVTAEEKARPYYFTRWYYCQNSQCDTALIMPEAFKVWNDLPS